MTTPYDRYHAQTDVERDATIARLRRAGWSYRQIAERVGETEGAVRTALKRVREGQTRA
jgi:DNA-directed RNA polymerase specialized sigma24 family protein